MTFSSEARGIEGHPSNGWTNFETTGLSHTPIVATCGIKSGTRERIVKPAGGPELKFAAPKCLDYYSAPLRHNAVQDNHHPRPGVSLLANEHRVA